MVCALSYLKRIFEIPIIKYCSNNRVSNDKILQAVQIKLKFTFYEELKILALNVK
jgi:hypothetical protein